MQAGLLPYEDFYKYPSLCDESMEKFHIPNLINDWIEPVYDILTYWFAPVFSFTFSLQFSPHSGLFFCPFTSFSFT